MTRRVGAHPAVHRIITSETPPISPISRRNSMETMSSSAQQSAMNSSSAFSQLSRDGSFATSNLPRLSREGSLISHHGSLLSRQGSLIRRGSSIVGGPMVLHTKMLENASKANLRWVILLLSCLLLFGNYFAYDLPSSLNRPLELHLEHDYVTWQYELNLLYSVYSFPNMVLPFVGGHLVDHCDLTAVLLGFSLCVCLGQILFSIGVSMKMFPVMLAGRILFGVGGEIVGVIQSSITTSWFTKHELAFALGLNLSISRLGSVANSILSPRIDRTWGTSIAVWTGTAMCLLSFLCALILIAVGTTNPRRQEEAYVNAEDSDNDSDESNSIRTSSLICTWISNGVRSIAADIRAFPTSYWLVCVICIMLYGTVISFNVIASDFLMDKWYPGDTQMAGLVMSIPDSISAFLVPLWGAFIDKFGRKASVLVCCSVCIGIVHATLGLTHINPIISMVVLGIAYSVYGVSLWPSFATIILHEEERIHASLPENSPMPKLLGSAYGVSTAALNTALTLIPLLTAQIRVSSSFVLVEMFFVGLACSAFTAAVALWLNDQRNGSILELPEEQLSPTIGSPDEATPILSGRRSVVTAPVHYTDTMTTITDSDSDEARN